MEEELYKNHINVMFGTEKPDDFSNDKIDHILSNLLECMPNGGKLYMYRKIDNEKDFRNTYSSLDEGYLWASRVDKFKDTTDCIVNYDSEKEGERIKELLYNRPELVVKLVLRDVCVNIPKLNVKDTGDMVKCFDYDTGEMDEKKVIAIFRRHKLPINTVLGIIKTIKNGIKSILDEREDEVKNYVKQFLTINDTIRHNAFVCSLSESFATKNMWETYANVHGICIEYDYNLLKNLPYDARRLFLSTYKVIYSDEPHECSFIPYIENNIERIFDNNIAPLSYIDLLNSTITKSGEYDYEKEWRTYHYFDTTDPNGYRIEADIVSKIIIDESALELDNAKEIIKLSQKYKWPIEIRWLNISRTKYNYTPYDEYLKIPRISEV